MRAIPRIVVAGVHSGVGKTSLTLGLVALLRRRGLKVQTFKVGPDYLDPTYLAMVSGRPCYNLDGWMTSREYVEDLFARKSAGADIAVIEGVMGLFDGADPVSLEGSTAQIANWLDAPVALVADVHGMARSIAALVHGYATFDPGVRVAGVIANRCGSEGHAQWVRESVEASSAVKVVGSVLQGGVPELSSRHLGLVTAGPASTPADLSERLVQSLNGAFDLESILQLARAASFRSDAAPEPLQPAPCCRLGVARDDAFHFYYPDNLEALERAGCELVHFSPLNDDRLPEALNGIYLGGGYPEVYAAQLSANTNMRAAIRRFPGTIYAECGGLMYLTEGIETSDGARHPQVGLLPSWSRMREHLKILGYAEVTFSQRTLLGDAGDTIRGHEYHYSELTGDPGWDRVYRVQHRRGRAASWEGFSKGSVLASYLHLHFASHPSAVQAFVERLVNPSGRQQKDS